MKHSLFLTHGLHAKKAQDPCLEVLLWMDNSMKYGHKCLIYKPSS